MLELILARHGQSYGNLDRALGADTDLTDLGREQAAKLAQWLVDQHHGFTALYCSPLRRARQTAAIINAHFGLDIILDHDLREAERPYLESLPQRGGPLGADLPPPYSAEYEAMRERVVRALGRILEENLEGHVLVVAHAGTLGTMMRGILGTHALLLRTDLTGIHRLSWTKGRWNLQYVNRQDHLILGTPSDP